MQNVLTEDMTHNKNRFRSDPFVSKDRLSAFHFLFDFQLTVNGCEWNSVFFCEPWFK